LEKEAAGVERAAHFLHEHTFNASCYFSWICGEPVFAALTHQVFSFTLSFERNVWLQVRAVLNRVRQTGTWGTCGISRHTEKQAFMIKTLCLLL